MTGPAKNKKDKHKTRQWTKHELDLLLVELKRGTTKERIAVKYSDIWRRSEHAICQQCSVLIRKHGLDRVKEDKDFLSSPMTTVRWVLGKRLEERSGQFWLDKCPASLDQVMLAANRVLKRYGMEQIGTKRSWLVD